MENQPLTSPSKKRNLKPLIIALVCILVLAGCGSAFAFVILPNIQAEDTDKKDKDSKTSSELTDKEKLIAGMKRLEEDFASDFNAIDQYLGITKLEEAAEKNPAKSSLTLGVQSINDVNYDANFTLDAQTDAANQVLAFALSGKYNDVFEGDLGQIYLSPEKISFASPLISKDKVFSLKLENLKEQLAASVFSDELDAEFYEDLELVEQYMKNLSLELTDEQIKKFMDEFMSAYQEDWTAFCEAITVTAEGPAYTVTVPQKESLRILGDFINYTVNHPSISSCIKDLLKFVYDTYDTDDTDDTTNDDLKKQYPTFDEYYEGTYGTVQKSINLITGEIGNYWKNDIVFTVDMNDDGQIQSISYNKELGDEEETIVIALTASFEETDSLKTIDSTWKAASGNEEISLHFVLTQTPASSDVLASTLKMEAVTGQNNESIVLNADCSLDKNTKAIQIHGFINGTNTSDSLVAIISEGGSIDSLEAGTSLSLSIPLQIYHQGKQMGSFTLKNSTLITDTPPASLPGNEKDILTITEEEWEAIGQEAATNLESLLPANEDVKGMDRISAATNLESLLPAN